MAVGAHDQQVDLMGCDKSREDVSDRSISGIDFVDDDIDPMMG